MNPFLKIKTKDLVWWALFGIILVGSAIGLIDNVLKLESEIESTVSELGLYSWFFYWVYRKCKQAGIRIGSFLERGEQVGVLSLVGLVLLLYMLAVGSILLTTSMLLHFWPRFLESDYWKQGWDITDPTLRGVHFGLDTLTTIVVAPIVEEILFRGVLLNHWATKWGARTGILASAVVFGILHLDIPGSIAFGVCMSLLYLKSRTLLVPVIVHASYNALVVAVRQLATGASGQDNRLAEGDALDVSIGVVLIAISLPVILYYISRNWPERHVVMPHSEANYDLERDSEGSGWENDREW